MLILRRMPTSHYRNHKHTPSDLQSHRESWACDQGLANRKLPSGHFSLEQVKGKKKVKKWGDSEEIIPQARNIRRARAMSSGSIIGTNYLSPERASASSEPDGLWRVNELWLWPPVLSYTCPSWLSSLPSHSVNCPIAFHWLKLASVHLRCFNHKFWII